MITNSALSMAPESAVVVETSHREASKSTQSDSGVPFSLDDIKVLAEVGDLAGKFYPNVDDDVYHDPTCPGYSSTFVKRVISRSPKHAIAARLESSDAPALRLGRAFHALTLQPEVYSAKYITAPEGMRRDARTKAYQEFMAENAGKTILSLEEAEQIQNMQAAVMDHPLAYLLTGRTEVSGWWKDEETGVLCKMRADVLRDDGLVLDLKSCESADPNEIERSIHRWGYAISGAMYLAGVSSIMQMDLRKIVLVFVEKNPPYDVVFADLNGAALEKGMMEFRRGLQTIKQCESTRTWPGYSTDFVSVGLPAYAW